MVRVSRNSGNINSLDIALGVAAALFSNGQPKRGNSVGRFATALDFRQFQFRDTLK
jgi:hypothetical protein